MTWLLQRVLLGASTRASALLVAVMLPTLAFAADAVPAVGAQTQSASATAVTSAVTSAITSAATSAATVPTPASSTGMLQVMVGLILVLAVLMVIAWGMKKLSGGKHAGGGAIKIVGGVHVGNRERILVIEVANEWIVVGVTATSINALSTMPKQEGVDLLPTLPLAKNFSTWLQQTIDKRNSAAGKTASGSDHVG